MKKKTLKKIILDKISHKINSNFVLRRRNSCPPKRIFFLICFVFFPSPCRQQQILINKYFVKYKRSVNLWNINWCFRWFEWKNFLFLCCYFSSADDFLVVFVFHFIHSVAGFEAISTEWKKRIFLYNWKCLLEHGNSVNEIFNKFCFLNLFCCCCCCYDQCTEAIWTSYDDIKPYRVGVSMIFYIIYVFGCTFYLLISCIILESI